MFDSNGAKAEYIRTIQMVLSNFFFLCTGAAAASRLYVDAVGKLGRQAQQGTWGGCADIGMECIMYVILDDLTGRHARGLACVPINEVG